MNVFLKYHIAYLFYYYLYEIGVEKTSKMNILNLILMAQFE